MGCFKDTCRLSGMPIKEGDECVIYHIVETHRRPFVYPTDMYKFIGLPYVGKYNDYGGYDVDLNDSNLLFTLQTYKKYALKKEVGENKHHDVAVDPEHLDYEKIQEAIWENRLEVEQHMIGKAKVYLWPILKHVYEEAIKISEKELDQIYEFGPNVNEETVQNIIDLSNDMCAGKNGHEIIMNLFKLKEELGRKCFLMYDSGHFTGDPVDIVDALGVEKSVKFLNDFRYFNLFLRKMNVLVHPGITSGQESNYQTHLKFHEYLCKSLQNDIKKENEYEND